MIGATDRCRRLEQSTKPRIQTGRKVERHCFASAKITRQRVLLAVLNGVEGSHRPLEPTTAKKRTPRSSWAQGVTGELPMNLQGQDRNENEDQRQHSVPDE